MNPQRMGLKKGQKIRVKAIELQFDGDLIVDYEGFLFRVVNESIRRIEPGEILTLVVRSENPLQLQIEAGSNIHFDRFA